MSSKAKTKKRARDDEDEEHSDDTAETTPTKSKKSKAQESEPAAAPVPTQPKSKKGTSAVGIEALSGKGSAAASKRLIKELTKITEHDVDLEGYEVECVDDNLYHWKVKLFGFAEDTAIYKDLKSLKGDAAVELDVVFPQDYPWSPPFIRVLRPRFQFRTGHVTMGGSICMELLTKTGWAPANTVDSIIVQIRAEMIAGDARIDTHDKRPYTESEAREAFQRAAMTHGWQV